MEEAENGDEEKELKKNKQDEKLMPLKENESLS